MSMPDIIAPIIVGSTPREQHTACGVLGKDDTVENFSFSMAPCFRVSVEKLFFGIAPLRPTR